MKLYKYRVVGEEGSFTRAAIEQIMLEGKLWFSKPSGFEDKLDCRPIVRLENAATLRRWLIKNCRVPAVNPRKPTSAEVTRLMRKHQLPGWMENKWFEVADSITAVCCLSQRHDLEFQWKNYAHDHSGVCFEIDTDLHIGGINPRNVIYTDTRPEVSIDRFVIEAEYRENKAYEVLTTKLLRYAAEEETRILRMINNINESGIAQRFDSDVFSNIYLGKNISKQSIAVLESLAKKSNIQWNLVNL